jgi:hypothetical protein
VFFKNKKSLLRSFSLSYLQKLPIALADANQINERNYNPKNRKDVALPNFPEKTQRPTKEFNLPAYAIHKI